MAVSRTPSPQPVSGTVAAVNPKGCRLAGHDGWFNFSQFARALIRPTRGQVVTLVLDGQGFVRSIQAADGPQATPGPRTAPGAARDVTITRLAVLKAAAEFGAARPDLKSADVLAI